MAVSVISHVNVLKEVITNNTKMLEEYGKDLQLIIDSFNNQTFIYLDEPSQLTAFIGTVLKLIEKISKIYNTDVMLLNVHVSKYTSEIENEIISELNFISETCLNFFENITLFKKEALKSSKKLTKLKKVLKAIQGILIQ